MFRLRPLALAASATRYNAQHHLARPVVSTTLLRRLQSTVSDSIKHDHRELEEYYTRMMTTSDPAALKRWQNQFVWELARHSVAEEIIVYPALEKYCPDGHAMAERDRADHQVVKEKLYTFQDMDPENPEFLPTLQSLWEDLSHHVRDEEGHDLPALEKALERSDSEEMAKSFLRTKHFVPTRSHPSAPNRPPYETVAGMLATPMDKLRDMFAQFPREEEKKKSAEMIG